MKKKHTQKRSANRCSSFRKSSQYGFSAIRSEKRGHNNHPKTYGFQTRLQSILLACGKVKFIKHAITRTMA